MANGLLDFMNTPQGMGLLSAVGAGMAGARKGQPWNTAGMGLLGGVQGYAQAQDNAWQNEQRGYQRDQINKQKQIDALAPQFYRSPTQNALMAGGGPTNAAASALPSAKPSFDTEGYTNALMGVDPMKAVTLQAAMAKESPFGKVDPEKFTPESVARFSRSRNYGDLTPARKMELAPNGQVWNPYQAQQGQTMADPNKPFSIGPNGQFVPNMPFQQFEIRKHKAGASNTSVVVDSLGLKPKDRFEMEGKLSDDYAKAVATDRGVLNATSKIRAAFTQSGALKDQAAIYAFAKMLDPDGAVREADYGAISGSAGLIDRARNYAQKLINGEQLTPTQRQEMIKVSEAFDNVAKQRIGKQRERYKAQAGNYNLRSDAVLDPQEYTAAPVSPQPQQGGGAVLRFDANGSPVR